MDASIAVVENVENSDVLFVERNSCSFLPPPLSVNKFYEPAVFASLRIWLAVIIDNSWKYLCFFFSLVSKFSISTTLLSITFNPFSPIVWSRKSIPFFPNLHFFDSCMNHLVTTYLKLLFLNVLNVPFPSQSVTQCHQDIQRYISDIASISRTSRFAFSDEHSLDQTDFYSE